MQIDPAEFRHVPLNSREPTACSPTPPGPRWRGLLIRAPRSVRFEIGNRSDREAPAQDAVPLCGYSLLDIDPTRRGEKMRIIAVDRDSGRTYSGMIEDTDPSPEEPPPEDAPPLDPKMLSGVASGGYFNVNLLEFVHLPAATASYEVHVELRTYRSNHEIIRIEYSTSPAAPRPRNG